MNVFSVIIIAIAGVGILNLLLMAVYERTWDWCAGSNGTKAELNFAALHS